MRRKALVPVELWIVALAILCAPSVLAPWLADDRGGDFRVFMLSAQQWRSGLDPYAMIIPGAPNLNHPALLPFFWPLSLLPFSVAYGLWTCVGYGVILWCARLIDADRWWWWALLIAATTPVAAQLVNGQIAPLITVLFTFAWLAAREGRPSGVWLGVLCALKPFYGLLLVYMALRRDWKSLAVSVVTMAVLTLAGIALVGTDGIRAWLAQLSSVGWLTNLYNASWWGLGAKWFTRQTYFVSAVWTPLLVSPHLAWWTGAVLSLWAVGWALWRVQTMDADRAFPFLGLVALLASPLGWIYYLPVVVVPLARTASRRIAYVALTISCVRYAWLTNHYGPLGTILIGAWASAMVLTWGISLARSETSAESADRLRSNSPVVAQTA